MNKYLLMILSIVLSILATWTLIPILRKKKYGQFIRQEGNQEHLKKAGTPTMGGLAFTLVFIVLSIATISYNKNILFVILTTFLFGLIGFLDDFEKITKKQNLGLNEKQKLILQVGIAFVLALLQYYILDVRIYNLDIPFVSMFVNVGIFIVPILTFIIVGTVNATNFTDGLDGLLSSVSIPVFVGIAILGKYTNPEITNTALIFAGVLAGFLVFNSYPASIFMGDTGSMAIGGAIVSMLIILNKPLYLVFIGFIYMAEVLSVIIQRFSYKKFKKRVFLMSPIHHHFELKGHKETKIVAGFTVLSIALTALTIYLAS